MSTRTPSPEARKLQAQLAAQTLEEDTRWLMDSPRGRRLMWQWLGDAGMFSQTFAPGAPDVTGFNEGRRSVALKLYDQVITHCPEQFVRMMLEHRGGVLTSQGGADTAAS